MELNTSRFGKLEIREEEILFFKEGLIGFEENKKFVLIKHKEDSPFIWLQSIENEKIAFLLIDPFSFYPEYEFEISDEDQQDLKISEVKDIIILTTASIPENSPKQATANLLGPIVINQKEKLGKQIILDEKKYKYSLRHQILQENK